MGTGAGSLESALFNSKTPVNKNWVLVSVGEKTNVHKGAVDGLIWWVTVGGKDLECSTGTLHLCPTILPPSSLRTLYRSV